MNNKVIMHINYAEFPGGNFGRKTIDDVCRFAAETGFDGIEFRGSVPKHLSELSFREYAEQIAAGKKKYGLSAIMFGFDVPQCTNADHDVREACIEGTIEKAKIAREVCGSEVCNTSADPTLSKIPNIPYPGYEFHGSAVATERDWSMTADAFARIGQALEQIGLRFAFETHMNYIHDVPAAAKKLVDLIDSPMVGINIDYGNTVYFPTRPALEETIKLYGDKLFHTHLKNSICTPGTNNLRMATSLDGGEINHRAYLETLKEIGYEGPIGIEAPRPGDRLWFAKCDLAYTKQLMLEI